MNDIARPIPFEDCVLIDAARRSMMAAAGLPAPEAETPAMTTREEAVPTGEMPIEIHTLTVLPREQDPSARARLTNLLRSATGIDGLRPVRDSTRGHWRYDISIRTRCEFSIAVELWRQAATFPGISYARLDGLSPRGIWVLETGDAPDTGMRHFVSGPEDK